MFEDDIRALAEAKQRVDDITREHKDVLADIATAKSHAKQLEENLRESALEWFQETGQKDIHDAISVRSVSKKSFNTRQNALKALENAPQVLTIDPGAFKAVGLLLAAQLRLFRSSDDGFSDLPADSIARTVLNLIEVDDKAMKELVKDGRADWATPVEEVVPTVYLSSRLGEYLLVNHEE